ncbi:hypothetical protein EG329_010129 [Mollisiaceae sp. DMI_Dod_QoI]|nr:hypothetical protein EG329_010129 [Helotiales sp. DMI_Dod_QoI]
MDAPTRAFSFEADSIESASVRVSNSLVDKAEKERLNYKPTPLKSPFLASLFLILCILIAVLEYARHILPVTKDGRGIPQGSLTNTTSTILSVTPGAKAITGDRTTLNVALSTTSQGYSVARAPSAWVFKNVTTNGTSSGRNESTLPTSVITPGNLSALRNFTELHQVPGNYPSLDDLYYGPIVHITLRCNWEAGPPGQVPLWAGDITPRDQCDCNSGVREWYSDDPLDCAYQFMNVYFDQPTGIPWKPGTMDPSHAETGWIPIIMDDGLDGRYTGGWWDGTRNFPNDWSQRDLSTCNDSILTTVLRVTQQLTITSLNSRTQSWITEVLTGNDGPGTVISTTMIPGGMSTVTTNVTLEITATRMAGRSVWTEISNKTMGNAYDQPKGIDASTNKDPSPAPVTIAATTTNDILSNSLISFTSRPEVSSLGSSPQYQSTTTKDILSNSLGSSTSRPVVSSRGSSPQYQATAFTLRDGLGVPTATSTEYLEILTDSNGSPTGTQIMILETLTDSSGQPTATVQEYLEAFLYFKEVSSRVSTATVVVSFDILTGSSTQPPATVADFTATGTSSGALVPTDPPSNTSDFLPTLNRTTVRLYTPVSHSNYFIVFFLPVLITVLLSIAIQMVDKNLKLMLPFHALNRHNGAPANDSICLAPGGITGPLHSIQLLFRSGEPLSLLSDFLVLISSLLVSISSEAIGIKLYGACQKTKFEGCSMYLDIFDGPSRATEGLMITMASIVALMGIFLQRTPSGVAMSPWSIVGFGSLLPGQTAKRIRDVHPCNMEENFTSAQSAEAFEGKTFVLQHYDGPHGQRKYGIILLDGEQVAIPEPKGGKANKWRLGRSSTNGQARSRHGALRRVAASHGISGLFLAILFGLLIVILYYNTTQLDPSVDSFERFMDGQTFGVRFFFTGLAVAITFFWDDLFSRITRMDPYKDLSQPRRRSNFSISASSATTVFQGLWRAIRNRNLFTGAVASAGILSKFMPLLLSNIPYRITQTWRAHLVCAWMTIVILAFMILVLLWSFSVKWPHMPMGPNTIAGNIYYLCDSGILRDFDGMSMMCKRQWDVRVEQIGSDYRFGKMVGLSGQVRTGIYCSRKGVEDVEKSASPAIRRVKRAH